MNPRRFFSFGNHITVPAVPFDVMKSSDVQPWPRLQELQA